MELQLLNSDNRNFQVMVMLVLKVCAFVPFVLCFVTAVQQRKQQMPYLGCPVLQEDVDSAGTFPIVLGRFEQWLSSHGLGTTHKFAVVTDG